MTTAAKLVDILEYQDWVMWCCIYAETFGMSSMEETWYQHFPYKRPEVKK